MIATKIDTYLIHHNVYVPDSYTWGFAPERKFSDTLLDFIHKYNFTFDDYWNTFGDSIEAYVADSEHYTTEDLTIARKQHDLETIADMIG